MPSCEKGNLYRSYPSGEVSVSLASSQVRTKEERRKNAWYTLFVHVLNHHGILWQSCSYVYRRILVMS